MIKRSHLRSLVYAAIGAAVVGSLFTVRANATAVFEMDGNRTIAPYYQALTFSGFSADAGTFKSNNTGIGGQSMNTTYVANGATITANASTVPGGFLNSHNAASLHVTNANAADGYYVLAGYGSMTTARFITPDALQARAVLTWHVSGIESATPAGECNASAGVFDICSTARFDFSATAAANPDYYDMIDPSRGIYDVMTRFGPGTYQYSLLGMPLNEVITFGFWASAFVQVNPNQVANGSTLDYFANYGNTFDLVGIDLYDANDALLTSWVLQDETGQTVFDPNGRVPVDDVTSVPEPGTLALVGSGLFGAMLARRRRRRS